MINLQEKYFGILHSAAPTSYSDGKTISFSGAQDHIFADDFKALEDFSNKKLATENTSLFGYFGYELYNPPEKQLACSNAFINTPKGFIGDFKNVEIHQNYKLPSTSYKLPKVACVSSNMTKSEYLSKVQTIINRIEQGDVYQANLTRKFFGEFESEPDCIAIYNKLNQLSPAPFSAYLKLDDVHVISSSPELFLKIEKGGKVITCPIKGSKPKGNRVQLAISDKDRAENLMITDLMRNDLSRACQPGSVKVDKLFDINEFETITHMNSVISGQLAVTNELTNQRTNDDNSSSTFVSSLVPKFLSSAFNAISACFPPGSMTGAPKVKAMEIISELENYQRGIYSGALGYITNDNKLGNICQLSVVIRTIIIQGKKFEFQVGGGIVYDSKPEDEWSETMLKASAIAECLDIKGLCEQL